MKAVILAAGKGTRLSPLTHNRPKQMLTLAGKPLLAHILDELNKVGITDIIIVIGFKGDMIKDYIKDLHLQVSINFIEQNDQKGTGHATSIVGDEIGGKPFLLINGDIIPSHHLLKNILNTFRKEQLPGIVTSKTNNLDGFGVVQALNGELTKVIEKPKKTRSSNDFVNVGIYIITNEVIEALKTVVLSPRGEIELTDAFNQVALDTQVKIVETSKDSWMHISYPWDLLTANSKLLLMMPESILGNIENSVHITGPVMSCRGSLIKKGSTIEGPAFIGEGVEIGPNAYIRPFTSLDRDVKVGNACEIKNSIIMRGTKIPHLSYIGDSIVGLYCNLGAGTAIANLRFDRKKIKVNINNKRISSNMHKLGAILGDHVQTGVNTSLMPGIKVGCNAWIGPNIVVSEDVPPESYLRIKQNLIKRS